MRALSLPVGLLAAAAVLTSQPGCGGTGKELPKVVTAGEEDKSGPKVVVPEKSEPAATAVVERALKVTTDGHPERVQKAKANRLKMKGIVVGPGRPIPTERHVTAVWPDRYAQYDEMNDGNGPTRVMIRLRRPTIWVARSSGGETSVQEPADPKAQEAALAGEAVGRHWMGLLVPLADPKAVVFSAEKKTVGGEPADVVKAALPGSPVFTLWFSEKTGLLGRVDFAQLEPGANVPIQKFFALLNHRAFGGMTLPARVEYWHNGLRVEEWNVDSWEFPDSVPDAEFDAPK